MNITINQGTTDVLIDIEDLIDLLKYKLVALNEFYSEHIDVESMVIDIQKNIIHLEEYLLSIYKE